jgi:hypothetical protein
MRLQYQADPGGKLPAGSEQRPIRHRGRDRADRSDARNSWQTPADIAGAKPRDDTRLQPVNRGTELAKLINNSVQLQPRHLGRMLLSLVQRFDSSLQATRPFGRDDAEFRQMTAQTIDQHRPLPNQQIARLVQHQGSLLVHGIDGHEVHGGPGGRLADCIRIRCICLAALVIGFA